MLVYFALKNQILSEYSTLQDAKHFWHVPKLTDILILYLPTLRILLHIDTQHKIAEEYLGSI